MSFHGGLIGIIISMLVFSYYKKVSFFYLSDLVSTAAPIGIFFGRIANFINVELYGRVTSFPFAMIFPTVDNERRHPSQIYEAIFEGLIIFTILIALNKFTIFRQRIGLNTSAFLVMYGIFRFIIEYLREPDTQLGYVISNFTMGQLLSAPMILVGICMYFILTKYSVIRK